jgi:hypothetical protein
LQQAVQTGPLSSLLERVSVSEDVVNATAFLGLPASRQITGQVIHSSADAAIAAG